MWTVDTLINTDEKYVYAMEIALGQALQHIVCETVENAKQAINYLKRGNLGRATFLPIEAMKSRLIDDKTLMFLKTQKVLLILALIY